METFYLLKAAKAIVLVIIIIVFVVKLLKRPFPEKKIPLKEISKILGKSVNRTEPREEEGKANGGKLLFLFSDKEPVLLFFSRHRQANEYYDFRKNTCLNEKCVVLESKDLGDRAMLTSIKGSKKIVALLMVYKGYFIELQHYPDQKWSAKSKLPLIAKAFIESLDK